MPQIEKKSPSKRSKENPVSTIDINGKSVDELKDALAEIQATMRSRCLEALEYDNAKMKRLLDELAAMSRRLDDSELTDLERLATEQIITSWIQTTVTGYRLEGLSPGQEGGRMASFLEHRHNMAHNRLLRSMDVLARMRGIGIAPGKGVTGKTDEPDNDRHLVWTSVRGGNRDKVFAVRSTVMPPGSKHEIYTLVRRGDGWVRGSDDVEKVWDSKSNCMVEVPNFWSLPE